MLDKLDDGRKVVGLRRLMKALEQNAIETVYLADDAEMYIRTQVAEAAGKAGARLIVVPTMAELGKACGIEVKAAAAGLKK